MRLGIFCFYTTFSNGTILHSFGFFMGGLLAFLGVDRFEHLGHRLYLGTRC